MSAAFESLLEDIDGLTEEALERLVHASAWIDEWPSVRPSAEEIAEALSLLRVARSNLRHARSLIADHQRKAGAGTLNVSLNEAAVAAE
jgi:hypothetical protein